MRTVAGLRACKLARVGSLRSNRIARAAAWANERAAPFGEQPAVRITAGCERGRKTAASKARSAPAMFAPPICRRSRRNESRTELILEHSRFVGFDEDGGFPANIAASGASH
jgi:hypothetical protein